MPVVPERGPTAATRQPTPGPRASAQDFGSGVSALSEVGANIESATNSFGAIALEMQQRENADSVLRAEVQLRDAERAFTEQASARRGKDAFGITDEAEEWYQERIGIIAGELENDVQRELFNQVAQQRRQAGLNSVSRYEATQRRQSFLESADAVVKSAIQNSGGSAFNPQAIELEKSRIQDTIDDVADSEGWTPEIRKQRKSDAISAMHGEVISSMIGQKAPLAAQDYFKRHKKEISGDVRTEMEAQIAAATLEFKAFEMVTSNFTKESEYSDALAKGRDIKDKDLRKVYEAELNRRYANEVQARRENEAIAKNEAWKIVTRDGFGINNIPPAIWDDLEGTERARLQAYEAAKLANTITPRTTTDYSKLDEADRAIEAGEIREFKQLQEYEPFLKPTDFNTLRKKLQASTRIDMGDLLNLFEGRIGKRRDATGGRGVKKWNDNDRQDYLDLQEYVIRHSKEGDPVQRVEELVDKWFMDAYSTQNSILWNDPDTVGEFIQEGRSDFLISVPDEDQKLMQDTLTILRASGFNFDEDRGIDELYTSIGFDAQRFFIREGIEVSPVAMTAFATLRLNGHPITRANVEFVIEQLNGN